MTTWNFCWKRQFWWCHLKIWTAPNNASWHFSKNKPVFFNWFQKINWLYYHELSFLKNKAVLMLHLKIYTAHIIVRWSVHESKTIPIRSLCISPYSARMWQNTDQNNSEYGPHHHVGSTIKSPLKLKPSLEINLKIWPALRIRSCYFCKCIRVLMISVETLNYPYYQPPQCCSLQKRIWTATSKMELFVKIEDGLQPWLFSQRAPF